MGAGGADPGSAAARRAPPPLPLAAEGWGEGRADSRPALAIDKHLPQHQTQAPRP